MKRILLSLLMVCVLLGSLQFRQPPEAEGVIGAVIGAAGILIAPMIGGIVIGGGCAHLKTAQQPPLPIDPALR